MYLVIRFSRLNFRAEPHSIRFRSAMQCMYCTAACAESKCGQLISHLVKSRQHSFPVIRTYGKGVESTMKTQGEIESAICEGISRFEQDYMGRGPKDIRAYLLGDLIVVRLKGVLTAAEQHLVKSLPAEKGRDLLKQVRTHLIETARPVMEAMVQKVTGINVVSLHHDISTATGEEVVLFTLAEPPEFREAKKR
jgi:uncharacterized protein YbcI